MRPVRRDARPRRTRRGTERAGNEAGGDAAALECRDLKEWISGCRRARGPGRDPWKHTKGGHSGDIPAASSLLRSVPPSGGFPPGSGEKNKGGAAGVSRTPCRNGGKSSPGERLPP